MFNRTSAACLIVRDRGCLRGATALLLCSFGGTHHLSTRRSVSIVENIVGTICALLQSASDLI